MSANRPRHAQAFPVLYTFIGIAVAVCFVGLGIKALIVQQELKQGGERLKRLKKDLAELTIKNEGLLAKKDVLTSPPKLEALIRNGTLKLKPIDDKFVVRIGPVRRGVAVADAQPAGEGAH